MTRWAVLAGALCLLGAAPAPAPHNLHVANTRLVVEGNVMVARIRMFRDDLQKAIKRPVGDDAASKAAVAAYLAQQVTLTADGVRLAGNVLDSGSDMDADQPIWWVLVQWQAGKPVKSLGLKVQLMFDVFSDQQNIVMVSKQPGDERHGLYFHAGDRAEQLLRF